MGRKLAMHVVAASPAYLKAGDVPASFIETETALFRYKNIRYIVCILLSMSVCM
jgi:translation elongation factor EF-Ts